MAVTVRIPFMIESDSTADPDSFTCVRPFVVTDAWGVVTTQGAGGNVHNILRGAVVIVTAGLASDGAVDVLVRAATLVQAQVTFAVGNLLLFTATGTGRMRTFCSIFFT